MNDHHYEEMADELIKAASEEFNELGASVEAMRLATEEINKKLGGAYPNGLVAEIEGIKRRLERMEKILIRVEAQGK
jgi:hypothetical protein